MERSAEQSRMCEEMRRARLIKRYRTMMMTGMTAKGRIASIQWMRMRKKVHMPI